MFELDAEKVIHVVPRSRWKPDLRWLVCAEPSVLFEVIVV